MARVIRSDELNKHLVLELVDLMLDADFAVGVVYQIDNTVTVNLSVGRKWDDPQVYAYEVTATAPDLEQALTKAVDDLHEKRRG